MSKHTPGPWLARIDPPPKKGRIASTRMQMVLTSAPQSIAIDCTGSGETLIESEANAHLIAAAPELLSELRGVLEWARVEKAPLRQIEIDSIAALIAKAEGRK